MKVGFIGLGTMGGSMAYNALQGGNEMVVHDIRRGGGHAPPGGGRGMGRHAQGGCSSQRDSVHVPSRPC